MKPTAVLLTTLVTVSLLDLTVAKLSRANKCRYDRSSAHWSDCNPATNKTTRTLTVKSGQQDTCDQTKTTEMPCGRCRYDRNSAKWSKCDKTTNTKIKTLRLKAGQQPTCEQIKTIEKQCSGGRDRSAKGMRENSKYRCVYTSGDWSDCDDVTHMRSINLTLRKGHPELCDETKLIREPCPSGSNCEYERVEGNCMDNKKIISFTRVEGDPIKCVKKDKEVPCGNTNKAAKKAARKAAKKATRKADRQARRQRNKQRDD